MKRKGEAVELSIEDGGAEIEFAQKGKKENSTRQEKQSGGEKPICNLVSIRGVC
jgi:hypothetical protein